MPPPEAVAGTAKGPDGKLVKVAALGDEDKLTLARWIDIGCPIDREFDAKQPSQRGRGWLLDEQRPTLTLTSPQPGPNGTLDRILIGMYDYGSGLDMASFQVRADFPIDGVQAGENLAPRFRPIAAGIWELRLAKAPPSLPQARLRVEVRDRQGNPTRIDRRFSVQ
jgi:hypothetical protein